MKVDYGWIWVTALAVFVTACAGSGHPPPGTRPDVVPENWIADYDYEIRLQAYLRQQYAAARRDGLTAYVYIYSDGNLDCKTHRDRMDYEDFRALYAGRRRA